MQTVVGEIEVTDRNGDGKETTMMSIRMENGELKSCLLRRLLRDDEVRTVPRELVWDLACEVQRLAIECDEPPFPDEMLAGQLKYLADNPDAEPDPAVLEGLMDRRRELTKKRRTITKWSQDNAWKKVYAMRAQV